MNESIAIQVATSDFTRIPAHLFIPLRSVMGLLQNTHPVENKGSDIATQIVDWLNGDVLVGRSVWVWIGASQNPETEPTISHYLATPRFPSGDDNVLHSWQYLYATEILHSQVADAFGPELQNTQRWVDLFDSHIDTFGRFRSCPKHDMGHGTILIHNRAVVGILKDAFSNFVYAQQQIGD